MTTTVLAYQHLPPEVTRPLLQLGSFLIGICGYLAVLGLVTSGTRFLIRRYNGADVHDLWKEIVVFILCAGLSVRTFDIANYLHP